MAAAAGRRGPRRRSRWRRAAPRGRNWPPARWLSSGWRCSAPMCHVCRSAMRRQMRYASTASAVAALLRPQGRPAGRDARRRAARQDVAPAIDYPAVPDVTPNEIAKTLGVTGLTFRNWLRGTEGRRPATCRRPRVPHPLPLHSRRGCATHRRISLEQGRDGGPANRARGARAAQRGQRRDGVSFNAAPIANVLLTEGAGERRIRRMGVLAGVALVGLLADSRAAGRVCRLPANCRLPDVCTRESCRMVQG